MKRTMTLFVLSTTIVGVACTSISCGPSAGNSVKDQATVVTSSEGLAEVTHRFSLSAVAEPPVIAADGQGRIFVAWASKTDDAALTLFLARSVDEGTTFEPPTAFRKVPIYRFTKKGRSGSERSFSTHVLPRLVATSAGLFIGWVEALEGGPEVKFFVARSVDGGKTFSEPVVVHSNAALRPGFTALAANHVGEIMSAWLDGRNLSQQPFAALSNNTGTKFESEQMVYAGATESGVCPCCNLAICASPEGAAFVAFRNAEQGNRDIWIARSAAGPGSFESPKPVSPNHWQLEGCPHDGPALSLADDKLHVAWKDAHSGRSRVYFASTDPTELDFGPPQEISPHSPGEQGHPQIALDRRGTLHAVWDESTSPSADARASHAAAGHASEHHQHGASPTGVSCAIHYARLRSGATGFEPATAIAPHPATVQTHPSVISTPSGRILAVWKESSTTSKSVVVTRLAE